MPKGLYDTGRNAFLTGNLAWLTQDFRVLLLQSGYTVNLATHQYLSDIPSGARVATSPALAGKTATAGVADANDAVITSVPAATITAFVLYQHTGTDATSQLVLYDDTATGLPLTVPAGATVAVVWDDGANKIFKL
jgi:hypothetical protein